MIIITKTTPIRVVLLDQISQYLRADVTRVATALLRLAGTHSAVDVAPGQWVAMTAMQTPSVIRRGKLLEMVRREPGATAVPAQTNAHGLKERFPAPLH